MTPQIKKLTTSEVIEDKMKRMDSGVERKGGEERTEGRSKKHLESKQ